MLKWFDDARMIVAYNGREFDMRVLWRHYDGDEDRWRRHMGKLHDPMTTVTRAAGRRIKLDTLLRMNGVGGKQGTGCDAPRWWEEGRLGRLEEYCAHDTQALAELMTKAQIRLPGRGHADSATVRSALRNEADEIAARLAANKREAAHEQSSAEGGTGDEAAAGGEARRVRRRNETGGTGAPSGAQDAQREGGSTGSEAAGQGRSSRKRAAPRYDETNRRGKRKAASTAYMDRGRGRAEEKRHAINECLSGALKSPPLALSERCVAFLVDHGRRSCGGRNGGP
jgi:hypothetical protein